MVRKTLIAAAALAAVVAWVVLHSPRNVRIDDRARLENTPSGALPRNSSEVTADGITVLLNADVAAAGRLIVAVHDDAEVPVAGARVAIRRENDSSVTGESSTDRRGEAVFAALPAGSYSYSVESYSCPSRVGMESVQVVSGQTTALSIRAGDCEHAIGGWVRDSAEAPVAALELTAVLQPSTDNSPLLRNAELASVRSDRDGHFSFSGLQQGDYRITVLENSSYSGAQTTVQAGVSSAVMHVTQKRLIQIQGRVTGPVGEPLVGVKVIPLPSGEYSVSTDDDGHYEIVLRSKSERHVLRFLLEGFEEARIVMEQGGFADNEIRSIDVSLEPIGSALTTVGRLRDVYGNGVAGEVIQLHSPSRLSTYRAISGNDGGFAIAGVAISDDYRVWVHPNGSFEDFRQDPVPLTLEHSQLDIVLRPVATGTVTGRVTDWRNSGVAGLTFWLRSDRAQGRSIEVTTIVDGTFIVENVPAGMLTLATRSRPELRVDGIELVAGTREFIEVVLDRGDRTIRGQVVNTGGVPVGGAQVRLTSTDADRNRLIASGYSTRTDINGRFELGSLGDGDHRMVISAPGYRAEEKLVVAGTDMVNLALSSTSN